MRIPAEVVPPVANIRRESDDVSKPEPVTGAKGINNELSSALPKQPWPAPERPRREPHDAPENTPTEAENPPAAVERRQKERRSEKRPVLLDTRSKSGRRKAGGDVKINIKV
ncbi:MAG: hypothetical protein V5B40_07640 [Candidatus Accumulibacter meliphilus]|jgi:hypothetical protein|uniref:hypothetical protein n=1 Tax=Candidatus Accumulibacter meliphilus TaxID=2211374 RepID=UPI002FC32A77